MTLRLLVFGGTDLVGSELADLDDRDVAVRVLDPRDTDLCDADACARAIAAHRADVVVNTAYASSNAIETNESGHIPGAIAQAARRHGLPAIHLSTDQVFPGDRATPWREADPPAPCDIYGATRRFGEQAVLAAHGGAVILRTSWVFSARGRMPPTFEQAHPSAIADRLGCPTPAHDVARATLWIARALALKVGPAGIFHYCGTPAVSWQGFADALANTAAAKGPAETLGPAPGDLPRFSVLDCSLIKRTYGLCQPDWRRALNAAAAEIGSKAA